MNVTPKDVRVPPEDMWVLLLSTVRYSLGRKSYIVGVCEDFLAKYGPCLTPYQRKQTADEIRHELQLAHTLDGFLGNNINDEIWCRIAERLEKGDFGECSKS